MTLTNLNNRFIYHVNMPYPDDIENYNISSTINHTPPGIDTIPTKDSLIIAQRIDETNEHLYKISEKLDIIIGLLRDLKDKNG